MDPILFPDVKRTPPRLGWIHNADPDALAARADRLRTERAAAEARIAAADTGDPADWPAYDRANAEFDLVDDELALVNRRIDELEEETGWDALKEQRRDYWARVL